jgi:DNA-binding NtrC family response regulator
LLSLKPALKVIYTTGYSLDLKSPNLFLKEGVNFLQKPFGPSKLAHAVRNCLDGQFIAGGPLPN